MENIFFDYVDFQDSWVIGWSYDSTKKQLVFDLEVSLWKGHKKYTKPLPNEYTCYKRGALIFNEVEKINGLLPMNEVNHSVDPDGSIDFGNVEMLQQTDEKEFKITGDFGEVIIFCKNVELILNDE